jgi:hypothetical protein
LPLASQLRRSTQAGEVRPLTPAPLPPGEGVGSAFVEAPWPAAEFIVGNPPFLGGKIMRSVTNLYNERPTWLDNLHRALDRAVAAAYGWPEDIAEDEALARLLALNFARAGAGP